MSLSRAVAGRNREDDVLLHEFAIKLQAVDFQSQVLEVKNQGLAGENQRPAGKNPEGAGKLTPADSL